MNVQKVSIHHKLNNVNNVTVPVKIVVDPLSMNVLVARPTHS